MQVTWEDQQSINSFGRLIGKLKELEGELKAKQLQEENLQEALNDLTEMSLGGGLGDDDDDDALDAAAAEEAPQRVHYWLGEIIVEMSLDEAEQRLEGERALIKKDISRMNSEMQDIQKTLAQLKVTLYAKFGHDNINLDA